MNPVAVIRLISALAICILSYFAMRRWLQFAAALFIAILLTIIIAAFLQLL